VQLFAPCSIFQDGSFLGSDNMQYEINEVSVAKGELEVRSTHKRTYHPSSAKAEPDPVLDAWSRLFVLEQSAALIAKHLLQRAQAASIAEVVR
jgi:hypothetical protein